MAAMAGSTFDTLLVFCKTGNNDLLSRIGPPCYDEYPVHVPSDVVAKISRLLKILERSNKKDELPAQAWTNLEYLCNDRMNDNALTVCRMLCAPSCSCLDQVIRTIREGANVTTTLQTNACVWFLCVATKQESITALIIEKPNLLEAIMEFAALCIPLSNLDVFHVYRVIGSVLKNSEGLDRFVALGGIGVLDKALHHLLAQCIEEELLGGKLTKDVRCATLAIIGVKNTCGKSVNVAVHVNHLQG